MYLHFELKRISFGGYCGEPVKMFEEASRWIKSNPKAVINHAILFKDEGCYLDIIYEELSDKGIQPSACGVEQV